MVEVQSKTIENINLDGLSQQDNLSMKRFLDLDPSQYESVIYYKSDDAMSASEFVLVKFKDHSQQEPFKETIEKNKSRIPALKKELKIKKASLKAMHHNKPNY